MRGWYVWVLLLGGCGSDEGDAVEEVEITWMEGAGFGWALFNHRLSHLELRVADDAARFSVIGGTSTTGVVTEVPDTCDPDACQEFPFFDDANVALRWARAVAPVAVGAATGELVVGSAGGAGEVVVTLEGAPRANTVALIRGFALDTDEPLTGDPACYTPANGWLPRWIELGLGDPEVDGATVTVPIYGAFQGGRTLEDERGCLDDVADQAQVRLTIDVLVVSTDGGTATADIVQQASYPYSGDRMDPGDQSPPAAIPLDLGIADPMIGWSRLQWRFHEADTELRGAYVRTLDFVATPSEANGTATNFSPGTQLSGFDFGFAGRVVAADLGAPVTRGTVAEVVPAELDDAGDPVVHTVALP